MHDVAHDAPVVPNCEHAGLRDHIAQVGTVERVGELNSHSESPPGDLVSETYFDYCLIVDLTALVYRLRMNLENFQARLLIGKRYFYLAVETTWSEECRIKCVRSICGHDEFCATERVETIHLVQKLRGRSVMQQTGGHVKENEPP